jgi:hypothetical protein
VTRVSGKIFGAALVGCLATLPSLASGKTVAACQYLAASGLDWEAGRWMHGQYTVEVPFFLTISDGRLDPGSVAAIFWGLPDPHYISCAPKDGSYEICSDAAIGRTMFFDHDGKQGSVAYLIGSAQSQRTDGARDSLVVMPFVCQEM